MKKTKSDRHLTDPCYKEGQLSLKCLDKYNYVGDECSSYFDNYNTCRKFWDKISKDRRSKGIKPYLPVFEEREKIKAEYMKFYAK